MSTVVSKHPFLLGGRELENRPWWVHMYVVVMCLFLGHVCASANVSGRCLAAVLTTEGPHRRSEVISGPSVIV